MTTSPAESRRLHERAVIVDGHCDSPYRMLRHGVRLGDRDDGAHADLRSLRDGGVTASFFAAYVPPAYAGNGAAQFADRLIDLIRDEAERYPDDVVFAGDAAGIRKAKQREKLALLIGIEGGHAIEDSLETLIAFYGRGVRYMTLTHVNTNNWADSSGGEPRHGGLTAFGREVVRTMNQLGMIVDVSHVADTTFDHVLETSRVPVIASHSSCRAIARHPRNADDRMLRDLARNRGICMINFYTAFVNDEAAAIVLNASSRPATPPGAFADEADWSSFETWYRGLGIPRATLDELVDHIVHAATVAGIESVGIGSDFDGIPDLPSGLETAAQMPNLTRRLLERGFRDDEILAVLGGNFLRVFEDVEKGKG
jgi:membrane dipeptidase